MVRVSIRIIWTWVTSGKWFGKTFKICIDYKRNGKLSLIILKTQGGVFGMTFEQPLFHWFDNKQYVFQIIFFGKMSKTFFANISYLIGM